MVWVNVTNPNDQPAHDLRGEMRGADVALVGNAFTGSASGNLPRGGSASHDFFVLPRTTTHVSAYLTSNAPLGALDLEVASPVGKVIQAPSTGAQTSVALSPDDVNEGAFGQWTATVSHAGGLRGLSYALSFEVEFEDVAENVTLVELPASSTYQLYFNIWADEPYPTLPPNLTIWLNGTVETDGGSRQVSYRVGADGPAVDATLPGGPGAAGPIPVGVIVAAIAIAVVCIAAVAFRVPLMRRLAAARVRGGGK